MDLKEKAIEHWTKTLHEAMEIRAAVLYDETIRAAGMNIPDHVNAICKSLFISGYIAGITEAYEAQIKGVDLSR